MFADSNFDEDIFKKYFNGIISEGKIIDVLKKEYPEYFI
jgi:hypothetical protein